MLWVLTHKKDKLCGWVHSYYIKGRSVSFTHWPTSMCWPLRKILESHELLDGIVGWDSACKKGNFSIKSTYQELLGTHEKVN